MMPTMTHSATVTSLSVGHEDSSKQLVARLRTTFETGRTRPLEWRKHQLGRLIAMLTEQEAEIGAALRSDLGKSAFETALSETGFILNEAKFALKNLAKWMRPKRVGTPLMAQPGNSRIQPEPKGVVLIIAPWNYPLSMVLAPLVGVIAAGNTAVMKPSEITSHTSALIAKWLPRYLDPDAFAVVEGGVPQTTALLEQRFDHILYTGNEHVARIVMTAAAKHLTPVTLELGGKSPCLIDESADLEVAVSRIAWGKFVNAGQTCVAPDHVYVQRNVADKFVALLRQRLRDFYGEDPAKSADYCRIPSERHTARFEKLLAGQNIVHGGRVDVAQRYVEPTLVLNPDPESPLMQEEVFGPVLPVNVVDRLESVIEPLARKPKPLALYLFSRNSELEQAVVERISAGSVCINDTMMFMVSPHLPFGGVGTSGMGRYTGWFGFETFSHMKPIMKRGFRFDADVRYPPYTDRKAKLLKMLR